VCRSVLQQCVAVCCSSVSQCVAAVCRSVLQQCVAVCCIVLQCVTLLEERLGYICFVAAGRCSVLQFFSVCCSVLHRERIWAHLLCCSCVSHSCSVFQLVHCLRKDSGTFAALQQCAAVCFSVLQCVAVRCSPFQCHSVLQCVTVCCCVLQSTLFDLAQSRTRVLCFPLLHLDGYGRGGILKPNHLSELWCGSRS